MRTFYEADIRKRVKVLTFVLVGWGAIVAARLVQVQVFGHARAKAAVLRQAQNVVKLEPRRGNILDRNGEILACSLPSPSVVIRPVDKETEADEQRKLQFLKKELGLSETDVAYVLGRLREDANYTYVKKKILEADAARVMALKLPGVELEAGTRRYYPLGPTASHVLGGISLTGDRLAGVELRYNDVLKGEEGAQISYRVGGGRDRNYQTQVLKSPVPGKDIVLTIDVIIQYIVEKELARAVVDHKAAWGTVIVMDPSTGEILALASLPAYNVNEFPGPKEAWMNRAVQASYEPGSTFKIVTAAAARERNRVGFSELFDCSAGSIRIGGTTITDHERVGILSFSQVIIHSSNVGTALFAQRTSIPEFHETIKAFGFGAKTGIDLPGEVSGLVRPPDQWNKKNSLVHIAIGYEVMVTALQTLRSMNVFATGGLLVHPHVVKDAGMPGAASTREDRPSRAVSEKTAAELVDRVFARVVEEGTGKDGRLDGFGAAGKTGTAQKWDDAIKAYTREYTASFVGFTPLAQPRLSMIIVLDKPKDGYYGGQACAPVFKDIARQVLRYLRVPPERRLPPKVLTAGLKKGGKP
jgi:cell division protein FtsI (penicillin-binding protein 3)